MIKDLLKKFEALPEKQKAILKEFHDKCNKLSEAPTVRCIERDKANKPYLKIHTDTLEQIQKAKIEMNREVFLGEEMSKETSKFIIDNNLL